MLVWRIGRRTIGEPAASVAAVLLWVWPPYLMWKSDRAHGFYGSGLVLVCLVLLLVLRLGERRSRVDAALLGLVLGLGWWQTPQIVPIALPALLWLLWRQPAVIRDIWVALPVVVARRAPMADLERRARLVVVRHLLRGDAVPDPSPGVLLRNVPDGIRSAGFRSRPSGSSAPSCPVWSYLALLVLFALGLVETPLVTHHRSAVRHRGGLPVCLRPLAVDLDRGRASLRHGSAARAVTPGRAGADDALRGPR